MKKEQVQKTFLPLIPQLTGEQRKPGNRNISIINFDWFRKFRDWILSNGAHPGTIDNNTLNDKINRGVAISEGVDFEILEINVFNALQCVFKGGPIIMRPYMMNPVSKNMEIVLKPIKIQVNIDGNVSMKTANSKWNLFEFISGIAEKNNVEVSKLRVRLANGENRAYLDNDMKLTELSEYSLIIDLPLHSFNTSLKNQSPSFTGLTNLRPGPGSFNKPPMFSAPKNMAQLHALNQPQNAHSSVLNSSNPALLNENLDVSMRKVSLSSRDDINLLNRRKSDIPMLSVKNETQSFVPSMQNQLTSSQSKPSQAGAIMFLGSFIFTFAQLDPIKKNFNNSIFDNDKPLSIKDFMGSYASFTSTASIMTEESSNNFMTPNSCNALTKPNSSESEKNSITDDHQDLVIHPSDNSDSENNAGEFCVWKPNAQAETEEEDSSDDEQFFDKSETVLFKPFVNFVASAQVSRSNLSKNKIASDFISYKPEFGNMRNFSPLAAVNGILKLLLDEVSNYTCTTPRGTACNVTKNFERPPNDYLNNVIKSFVCTVQHVFKCKKCKEVYSETENLFCIDLNLKIKKIFKKPTLMDYLSIIFDKKKDKSVKCAKCKATGFIKKSTKIISFPDILIFVIPRINNTSEKKCPDINYSLTLQMDKFGNGSTNSKAFTYELTGVIAHSGGHVFTQNPKVYIRSKSQWNFYSEQRVIPFNPSDKKSVILPSTASILFYQRSAFK